MSIIHNLSEISSITVGSENIENIYLGEDLLWTAESSPYEPDQVIFEESTAGTYEVELLAKGRYEVICVGGGGGGCSNSNAGSNGYGAAAGGGSGGYSDEIISIPKGTYNAIVGAGGARKKGTSLNATFTANSGTDSSFYSISATSGTGGIAYLGKSSFGGAATSGKGTGGSGGSGITQNGNNGSACDFKYNTTVNGGTSVYNGYGKGGNGCATNPSGSLQSRTTNGTAGYVKIIYKGK